MTKTQNRNLESSIWPLTEWSVLGQAAKAVGRDAEQLNRMILKYDVPLRVYLLANFPGLRDQAPEILQDFAQDKILREGWLGKASPERGKLRNFLKTSLKNFVKDWIKKQRPKGQLEPLDDDQNDHLEQIEAEMAAQQHAENDFDLAWMQTILAETLRRTEEDCRAARKQQPRRSQIWAIFKLRVLDPVYLDSKPPSYEELVGRFNLRSPTEGTNMLLSAKRIFERHLLEIVGEYERKDRAAKTEIEELKAVLLRLVDTK